MFIRQKQPSEVFRKKSVLKYFTKFTGKHQCQSLFFNKVTCLKPFQGVFHLDKNMKSKEMKDQTCWFLKTLFS